MIDNILNSLKDQIHNSLENENLPEGVDTKHIAEEAGNTIFQKLSSGVAVGDMSAIEEMFSGKETGSDSAVMGSFMPDLVSNLGNKFGIDPNQAQGIIQKIMPSVMNMFNQKVSSGNFDIQSVINQFSNGNIGNIVNNIFDNQSDNNGGQKSSSSGGIFNIIKGLFGK